MDTTLIAALITAVLALIGVTLSKDTKVSEFRQKWADALRKDAAEFLGLIVRAWEIKHPPHNQFEVGAAQNAALAEKVEKLAARLNVVMYRILLRLDLKKKEGAHWELGEAMENAQRVALSPRSTRDQMNSAHEAIQKNAARVIDDAWERVKKGETKHRIVQGLCYVLLAGAILTFGYQTFRTWNGPSADTSTHLKFDEPVRVTVQPAPQPAVDHAITSTAPASRPRKSKTHRVQVR